MNMSFSKYLIFSVFSFVSTILTCHFLLKFYISDIFISCIVLFVIFVVLLLAPLPEICAVVIRSSFLAIVFFTGLCGCNSVHFEILHLFGWYLCVLSTFHFTEFIAIAVCSDDTLSIDSFLLNHSVEYWLAAILSWMEYFVEYYYFPSLKHVAFISKCGFMLTITGEVIRKLAIYSAGKGFSHLVSTKRKETHKLVTTGMYHFWRHPAYLGWLLWSVGTQLILCNPACFVGYSYVSWKFLKQRIQIEESYLVQFFGNEYLKYREKVPSGIPFVD
ncbi:Protein-S-isoprenylcysteine O-methyltransferase [Trichinella papuae]|uniref:Protein-S-isoprenylcysteine O-methyltransferase n=1 Tax=Trichinella papuae TaxID=268474 RepID=A0A0V1N1B4_9BILA|nr:Protein-S-isoprenylcysteine O-methyltransferase [Trichinella papuae]